MTKRCTLELLTVPFASSISCFHDIRWLVTSQAK